jgi:hypothetical protein
MTTIKGVLAALFIIALTIFTLAALGGGLATVASAGWPWAVGAIVLFIAGAAS